jgi:ribosomal protein S18 acetylase RimI-like enzyme
MTIRRATAEDAEQIASVRVAAWQAAYRGIIPDSVLDSLSVTATANRVVPRLTDPARNVFVDEEAGNILGFVMFGPTRDEDADPAKVAELYTIYLLPAKWGKGRGRALCTYALTALRELGFAEATLWVLRENQRAIGFYTRAGFSPDGATQELPRDSFVMHELRFRRHL